MVSAGAANKKAFGIDRTTNPWSDMVGHRRDLGRRLERGRVLAHHYELHLAGARAGREDHHPGSAHHAGGSHLRSVPAREARARRGLFAGVLQIMIERDWLDHAFIDAHTVGSSRSPSTAGSGRCRGPRR
jgi:assimilatory nitrate reductase catalytic subunit